MVCAMCAVGAVGGSDGSVCVYVLIVVGHLVW